MFLRVSDLHEFEWFQIEHTGSSISYVTDLQKHTKLLYLKPNPPLLGLSRLKKHPTDMGEENNNSHQKNIQKLSH